MLFLTKEDFKHTIRDEHLGQIIGSDDSILDGAERQAIALISSYLNHRYNMHLAWSKQGDQRHPLLVAYAIDLVLCNIFSIIAPKNIPEFRQNRCANAIEWLQMASKGEITVDLPTVKVSESIKPFFGSHPKNQHHYY